jgi:hypothetical protein
MTFWAALGARLRAALDAIMGRQAPIEVVPAGVSAQPRPKPAAMAPASVFTPTRPRSGRRNLVGREPELARILDAILLDGGHVVLYSERGRGKTSLSNMAIEALRRQGAVVGRFACEAQTTFDMMIRGVLRDLPASLLAAPGDGEGCEDVLPAQVLRPADVAAIPQHLACSRLVFVIDEFDRVQDIETRTTLADTIKLLSDRGIALSLIVVGVSATLEQIIGQHPSIERNIMAIHLPLLPDADIAAMLRKGGSQAGIFFPDLAVTTVVQVARGMPYMAQLMGLRMTQAAAQHGRDEVSASDVADAVQLLLRDTNPSVIGSYSALVGADPDQAVKTALESVADAEQDEWGRMRVIAGDDGVAIGGQVIPVGVWTLLREAGVLVSLDGDSRFVQFGGRPLMYYVQLLAVRERLGAKRQVQNVLS